MKKKNHSPILGSGGWGSRWLRVLSIFAVLSLMFASTISAGSSGTWVSSFQVMNLGNEETTIQVEYYQEDGTPVDDATHIENVAKGSSINIYQPGVDDLPEGFKGGAVVSAGQPIAAIAGLQADYEDGHGGASQYAAFSSQDVGTSFYLPNVNKNYGSGGWSSRITLQNAAASQVDIDITFYNDDASEATTETVTLEVNGSTTLLQEDNEDLPDTWLGSAVVEATDDVAVIVNVIDSDGAMTAYNGFSTGANTMYLPTLLLGFGTGGWNTSFQVLNVSSDTATVTMTYYTSGEATPAKTVEEELDQYESLSRYQPTDDSDLGAGWIGSVVVESTEPVVASVGNASEGGSSSYNGVAVGTTEAALPTVLRYFGGSNYVSSFQIMNVGGAAANITVDYYEPGDPVPVKTVDYDGEDTIAPFTSVNRYLPTDDEELGTGWQGSVRITSDQPVIALGNQQGLDRVGDAATQYNGIPITQ